MKRTLTLAALSVFLIFCSLVFSQTIAIKAGHFIDPASGKASKDQLLSC